MRCDGDRCTALVGEVGVSTSCAVYAVRPDVCRACLPGDDDCETARCSFNLWLSSRRNWPTRALQMAWRLIAGFCTTSDHGHTPQGI